MLKIIFRALIKQLYEIKLICFIPTFPGDLDTNKFVSEIVRVENIN